MPKITPMAERKVSGGAFDIWYKAEQLVAAGHDIIRLEIGEPDVPTPQHIVEAAERAMVDLRDLGGDYIGGMNLVALDKDGNHTAMTSMRGRTYIYQTPDMDGYAEKERAFVEIPGRWKRLASTEG